MSDPVAAVTEAEASGEIAEIFADIRAVYGVSVVNLIWRHLATFPDALPWAWGTVRPLYVGGIIAREAAELRAARQLPAMPHVPTAVFVAIGLTKDDLRQIGTVLDAYERTNPMALIALSVLKQHLGGLIGPVVVEDRQAPRTQGTETQLHLPSLLRLDQMAPATADLVLRLNRIGAQGPDSVLASMYRNLAHWPGYLALSWTMLAPLEGSGGLGAAIGGTMTLARTRAYAIATRNPVPMAALPAAQRAVVAEAIGRFTGDAISRMTVICGILRGVGLGG